MRPEGMNGARAREAQRKMAALAAVVLRWPRHHRTLLKYQAITRPSARCAFGWVPSQLAAMSGVSRRATRSEARIATTAVQPNCLNRRPGTPAMKVVGRKTTTRLIVVAITAR